MAPGAGTYPPRLAIFTPGPWTESYVSWQLLSSPPDWTVAPTAARSRGSTLQPGSARAEVLSSPDGALISRRSTRPSGRWAAARHALTRCWDAQRRTRSGSGQPEISAGAPRASRSCATQVWGLNDWQQNGHNDADGHNANDVALVDHQKVPDLFVPPCGGVEDAYVRGAASGANCGSRLFVRPPRLRTIVGAPG